MKKFSLYTTTILVFGLFFLSVTKIYSGDDKKEVTTKPATEGNIVVLPFQPSMYFNAGDNFICQANNITPGELNKMIRTGIANNMVGDLSLSYNAKHLSDQVQENQKTSDLDLLYRYARYSLEKKPLIAFYKNDNDEDGISNMFGLAKKENAPQYLNPAKPNLKSHNYFKARFANDTLITSFSKANNVSYYLFIDHFEMETHFKDCHDMQKNVSKRDLYVHYTLLNAENKFVDGGVVCYTYQSGSNNAKELIKNTMPVLSGMIMHEVKEKISKGL
ncbi:MAG: hypothetical protein NTX03_13925 [Bacteroidetes bacterium]|nr:hypothetical protein [Bacteroidota bacterium]